MEEMNLPATLRSGYLLAVGLRPNLDASSHGLTTGVLRVAIKELAKRVWGEIKRDLGKRAIVVALEGPLGAGKTTFTKELAKVMGIKSDVSSPTFVLHVPHKQGELILHHIDCWRMEEFGELEQIGLDKMIEEKAVIVIEWADKFRNEILDIRDVKIIWIRIEYGERQDERKVTYENTSD